MNLFYCEACNAIADVILDSFLCKCGMEREDTRGMLPVRGHVFVEFDDMPVCKFCDAMPDSLLGRAECTKAGRAVTRTCGRVLKVVRLEDQRPGSGLPSADARDLAAVEDALVAVVGDVIEAPMLPNLWPDVRAAIFLLRGSTRTHIAKKGDEFARRMS